jgi:hypothetical protein
MGWFASSISKVVLDEAPGKTIPANQFADTLLVVGIGVCRLMAHELASSFLAESHVAGEYR